MTAKITTALVTGGASGMGRICALRLAKQGTQVAIFDINEAGMEETATQSDNIHCFKCDVSNWEDVQAKVKQVTEKLGSIDRLTHAAAIMPSRTLVNDEAENVIRMMNLNFGGTVHMVKAILPSMLERDSGEMILFGSVAGESMLPNLGSYCASKAAVNVYAETLAWELHKTGINVHVIYPSGVDTPLVEQALLVDVPKSIAHGKANGQLSKPEDIVDAIEQGIAKGKKRIYPCGSRKLSLWHALMPNLWWKVLLKFEES
ncbi:MAG: NAD(P)-dependent dehydrogenase (short-subunit alcohol dehydrogenase family) [Pseudomonadales bacterium]|jgi:NAD(P)-dependent dehydrogenase (short-subunit alcohol dehydrogenase family)